MEEPETENVPTDQMSILHLNDDCLLQIASMLSLSDLLTLSQVCQRFEYIANVLFTKCKDLDMTLLENCTLMKIREIMSRVGPYVQKVKYSEVILTIRRKRFVDFLPKFCSNVKTLEFIWVKGIHSEAYRMLFMGFKNLTVLNLQLCDITDEVCAVLFNCKNLENLNLSENSEITGKYLEKLIKLKVLDLSHCRDLQPVHFNELMANVKLASLNIESCSNLNLSSMELLLRHQTELVKLSISNSYRTSNLSALAKLKCLEIHCRNDFGNMFFENLALHNTGLEKLEIYKMQLNASRKQALSNLKNLKELCIARSRDVDDGFINQMASKTPLIYLCCAGCDKISSNGILNLIRKSSTIEKIEISSCCQFHDELIFNAIDILKEKQRVNQLTFVIGNTSISPCIQMVTKFLRKNLLNSKFWHLFTLKPHLHRGEEFLALPKKLPLTYTWKDIIQK